MKTNRFVIRFSLCFLRFFISVQVELKIQQWNDKGIPVVGVLVEPIQAEGGDWHASPEFFQQLQQLCKKVVNC